MTGPYAADLELASRCAAGDPDAWDRFVRDYRPVLYRAADALDPGGGAREIADALYGELYGSAGPGGERRSLFRYYQGRSSLATWLRAVLSQRFVDEVRVRKRFDPLPDEPASGGDDRLLRRAPPAAAPDPDRLRLRQLAAEAVAVAIACLGARDRLRLACYYVQSLTLAETGRVTGEHEATVSRQLARTRRALRETVEHALRTESGLDERTLDEALQAAAEDPGTLDLTVLVGEPRKKSAPDRSKSGETE
jgi:RNA polymerase sigma factor (sigma-70 family)